MNTRRQHFKKQACVKRYKKLLVCKLDSSFDDLHLAEMKTLSKGALIKLYRTRFNLPKTPKDIKFKESIDRLKGMFTADEWLAKGFQVRALTKPCGTRFNGEEIYATKQVRKTAFDRSDLGGLKTH